MSRTRLFYRLVLRPLQHDPLRAALTLFAVSVGVAVVIAIRLSGEAAAGSFHSSLETLVGKAALEIRATGGLDEALLGPLVQLPDDRRFAPRIEDFATIEGRRQTLVLLGVDLVAEAFNEHGAVRSLEGGFQGERLVWAGGALGLRAGERIHLLINDRRWAFRVAGVLAGQDEPGAERALVTDIGIAQVVTGKQGKVDAVEVTLGAGDSVARAKQRLEAVLPADVTVEPTGTQTEENRRMLAAFRWNLQLMSYIALVVGGFLIYNAVAIAVVRRRAEIGILRGLGAPRALIWCGVLTEALLFGGVGGALGLALGRMLAGGAVGLVGSTVEALYVSSVPGSLAVTAQTVAEAVCIGVFASMMAALAPAVEASRVPPVESMARGRDEYVATGVRAPMLMLAALLVLTGAALAQLPPVGHRSVGAYGSVVCFIAAMAAAMPAVVRGFSAALRWLLAPLLSGELLVALRTLAGASRRTSVLVTALATAVSMMASVGIMVGSFRETVAVWMNNELQADFYLRPPGPAAADRHPTMGSDLIARLRRIPGVAAVDGFRVYPISYEGLPASLGGSDFESSASMQFLPGQGDGSVFGKLPTGDYVVVSEPFANKHRVHAGSELRLRLGGAVARFHVLGVFYDYSTERGFIIMDRRRLLRYLPDDAVSNAAVYVAAHADMNTVRAAIDAAVAGRGVLVFSNGRLRREALAVFERTFAVTYALEAVAIFVAVVGMAGALITLIIDRRREFALLRFLGGSAGQIRSIVLVEAGLLGLLSNSAGFLLGVAVSLILVFVVNKQSFGWTIQFHWPVPLLLGAISGIYVATILAGLAPARMATRLNPIAVLHED